MNDPGLNALLQWGIKNSDGSADADAKSSVDKLSPEWRDHVLGAFAGDSQADLMYKQMDIIKDPQADLDAIVQAFEDFDDLITQIDNANYMENKLDSSKLEKKHFSHLKEANSAVSSLWTMLLDELEHEEAERRAGAAKCIGTAVENNSRAQANLVRLGGVPKLVRLATEDQDKKVRKMAIGALSRSSRNFQPTMDIIIDNLPANFKPDGKVDAADMDSVTALIDKLRASV